MRVIFYSVNCEFSKKLLEYIDKNSLSDFFKLICIDDLPESKIPKNITIVPTLIDTSIEAPLEGKKAFEYVINQKYFNHPTNNVDFTKNGVPKPSIEEDTKANVSKTGSGFIYVNQDTENKFVEKDDKNNFDKVFGVKETNKQEPMKKETNKQEPIKKETNKQPIREIPSQKQSQPIANKVEKTQEKPVVMERIQVLDKIVQSTSSIKDETLNQLLNQRSKEDDRLQKLMKLKSTMK
jgi:hypothetical protein